MSIMCNCCQGTGFHNSEQIPEGLIEEGCDAVLEWMKTNTDNDVAVCGCCGDGEGWYGEPGQHYTSADPIGRNGPYASNGGLCKCH